MPADTLLPSAVSTYLCGSAGYDAYVGIGVDRKPGFRLTNAAGIMTIPIAEHCLTLMLALTRQIPQILDQQRRETLRAPLGRRRGLWRHGLSLSAWAASGPS